jgi:flavin-binding protein dodecin
VARREFAEPFWQTSNFSGGPKMSDRTYVVNEIVGTSTESVADAIKNGISRASQTIRHLDWFEVVEVRGTVGDGAVSHFQVTMKVGFRLEEKGQ